MAADGEKVCERFTIDEDDDSFFPWKSDTRSQNRFMKIPEYGSKVIIDQFKITYRVLALDLSRSPHPGLALRLQEHALRVGLLVGELRNTV